MARRSPSVVRSSALWRTIRPRRGRYAFRMSYNRMSARMSSGERRSPRRLDQLRTWVEISRGGVRQNVRTFRKLVGPRVRLWAVVKSNAYGHGLYTFSPLAEQAGVDPVRNSPPKGPSGARLSAGAISNGVDGFCVDSVVEGLSLRRSGITKPIL